MRNSTCKFIEKSIENTYLLITNKKTIDEICLENEIPLFFIEPEELTNQDIEEMIEYFGEVEEYEKCNELLKLKKENYE